MLSEEYVPKHRGEYKQEPKICLGCQKRTVINSKSRGLEGGLCIVCFYEL